jgi:hypothetical protein
MALLLLTRRLLLASPLAADIIINLFVLDQVCLVAATKALLSNSMHQQGACMPAGCRLAGRAQTGTKQMHFVCAQTLYKYVPSQSGQKISCKSIQACTQYI